MAQRSAQYTQNVTRLLALKAEMRRRRQAQPMATEPAKIVTHASGRSHWTAGPDGRIHRCPECSR